MSVQCKHLKSTRQVSIDRFRSRLGKELERGKKEARSSSSGPTEIKSRRVGGVALDVDLVFFHHVYFY
jgi:hypothetical protein